MTKEELEKEAEEYAYEKWTDYPEKQEIAEQAYLAGAEPREKRIAELEEKISVLLSCKNCPENKGGLICQKEYENKCLAQKIQHIKELQEENAELKAKNKWYSEQVCNKECAEVWGQLTKAMKHLKDLVYVVELGKNELATARILAEAKQFLNEDSTYERIQKAKYNYTN